ncbi:MAG TPA: hypothetical protein VMR45_04625 [Patescibacteria group bacterium]|nr:hypothetical protein [Patescibacteria group bacterium]
MHRTNLYGQTTPDASYSSLFLVHLELQTLPYYGPVDVIQAIMSHLCV